jgi:hypothetical protein
MSEVEFDRLLDAVREAVAPTAPRTLPGNAPASTEPPQAANDNQSPWPFFPFPDGWNAVC